MAKTSFTLYGLKTCDTCKKAQRALSAAGHSVTFVDIRADTNLREKVPLWRTAFPDRIINKSSTTWRKLSTTDKARAATNPDALLIANPTLIKRPIIEGGKTLCIGWAKDTQAALLE